jgi:hypothetical protein
MSCVVCVLVREHVHDSSIRAPDWQQADVILYIFVCAKTVRVHILEDVVYACTFEAA